MPGPDAVLGSRCWRGTGGWPRGYGDDLGVMGGVPNVDQASLVFLLECFFFLQLMFLFPVLDVFGTGLFKVRC